MKVMTHELDKRREDRFTQERRLRHTCGATSKELAWLADGESRLWTKEHNPERIFREWIGKHSKKEFSVQTMSEDKLEEYLNAVCRPIALTCNIDGLLRDGDVIRLKWPFGEHPVFLATLPRAVSQGGHFLLPTRATGTEDSRIMIRSAFHVCRSDARIPTSVPLMYDECIYISTTYPTGPANAHVMLSHVVTNQKLALEEYRISTIMGNEYEVSARNLHSSSRHKNLWIFEVPYNL